MALSSISLYLKNFKGVEESSVTLPKVSILVGGNNSGKSTVLEALFIVYDPFRYVPYSCSGAASYAVDVLNYLHSGLGEESCIFLLRDYTASGAVIEVEAFGEKHNLHIYSDGGFLLFYELLEESGDAVSFVEESVWMSCGIFFSAVRVSLVLF